MVIRKCTDVFRVIFRLGGEELRRGEYAGGTFLGGIGDWGEKIFMKGVQDYLALFKNIQ